jgi:dTDP-N-acetylfucosamine:lipid II N-acetylfucosaminyltransferase
VIDTTNQTFIILGTAIVTVELLPVKLRFKVLHIITLDKFIPPYIDFLEAHFEDFSEHLFFISGDELQYPVVKRKNTIFESELHKSTRSHLLSKFMHEADKIILHSLFDLRNVQLLVFRPWVLKRCFWVIWGGDLYDYRHIKRSFRWYKYEMYRRFIIKRMGHLVTYIKGDVDLARKWYGARGKYQKCLMYPSNLFKEEILPIRKESTINIQIGNSAHLSNEHFEMIKLLEPYKELDIKIFAPLSYGRNDYAHRVMTEGKQIFGDKFIAILEFMSLKEYLKLLGKIDIAIFNHRRQQGMGNIINLLGLGKKVYMRNDVTPWNLFQSLGIRVYDVKDIELTPLTEQVKSQNINMTRFHFSEKVMIKQYQKIFNWKK